tara:strand:- start:1100 stop:1222 length:123 start_codon:yes stop_codon:yes gene_type:complete
VPDLRPIEGAHITPRITTVALMPDIDPVSLPLDRTAGEME